MTFPAPLFADVRADDLRAIAAAIRSGRLRPPFTGLALDRVCLSAPSESLRGALQGLADDGCKPQHVAVFLDALAAERGAGTDGASDAVDLVWSGPEAPGTASRDTAAVLGELFASAENEVLLAGYAVYHGRELFRSLAARMEQRPELSVRMFLDVRRHRTDTTRTADILKRFAADFLRRDWSGPRLPEIYYDPRALETTPEKRAALHAKCAIIDRRVTLVTSANFTPAAQTRNIEVGTLIRSPRFSTHLAGHFDALIACSALLRLPLSA